MEALFDQLKCGEKSIAVIGLGYVGLPLAYHLSRKFRVVGFDIDEVRIDRLRAGHDETREVSGGELASADIEFSNDPRVISAAALIIVAVPTPIDEARQPNLEPLLAASRTIGAQLRPGSVVVYESTVFPGVTEEVCGPILAETSGLVSGRDFFLGYSPERINPGDKEHSFDKIVKVVSGQTPAVLKLLADVYGSVVTAGVHRASSIKTAEAAKVIENTQRDLNIALMNELAIIFNMLHINTQEVLEAAGTKWNFLNFQPGLVGGHCIGVDPYYLTYLAQKLGYHPRVILAGRQINDAMAKFVVEQTVKQMIKCGIRVAGSKVLVLGLTFKEDVPDLRNSKVFDLIRELREYDVEVLVHDPVISPEELMTRHGEQSVALTADLELDGIILAVCHESYRRMGAEGLIRHLNRPGVFIDVKSTFEQGAFDNQNIKYWRL